MNNAYQIIDDKVVVTSDWGFKTTREITNNIEEILITENNIEEIQNLIIEEKDYQRNKKSTEMLMPSYLGLSSAQLILCISRFIVGNIAGGIIHLIASTCFFTTAYMLGIAPAKKRKNTSKRKIEVLVQKLSEEQDKLFELKKDKTNDLMCITPERKTLSTSIQIEILKDRLNDINLYVNHRHKIIRLYKKGLLESELFEGCASRDTINFIIQLVKNDLGIENINENINNKQKKLTSN